MAKRGQTAATATETLPRMTPGRRVRWGLYNLLRWAVLALGYVALGLRVRGRRNMPRKGPVLIVANHLHNFDIIVLDAAIPRALCWMAKRELFERPWPARFFRLFGAFPVNRQTVDRAALRQAGLLLDDGMAVGVLPEGTRSVTHTLQRGNAGVVLIAQGRDIPIVPVAVAGTERLPFDVKRVNKPWFGRRVTVTIGEPIRLPPRRPGERVDLQAATDELMLAIAALLPPEYRGVYADRLPAGRDR